MADNYTIRELDISSLKEALRLTWDVFAEFEAPEYSRDGIQEFKDFIRYKAIKRKMLNEGYSMWGCYDDERIVGVLASKPPCHISLLFVDRQYHRKGIASALFGKMLERYRINGDYLEITVNSSPYAIEFYRKLGFAAVDTEKTVNGIRFTPMKLTLHSENSGRLTVKEAETEELPKLLELYTYLHDNPYPEMTPGIEALWSGIINDPNHHILLGYIGDKPVCSCVIITVQNLTHNQRPYALIENVITHPDYRNKGCGSMILSAAKDVAVKDNCYKIMLMTGSKEESVLDFYRKAGYNSEDKTAFIQWV